MTKHDMLKQLEELNGRDPQASQRAMNMAFIVANHPSIPDFIKSAIDCSPAMPKLLYELSGEPQFSEFVQLAHTEPYRALEQIVTLTALLQAE